MGEVVVWQVDLTNEGAPLSLQDTCDDGYGANISQLVFVHIQLGVAKIKNWETWVIFDYVFDIMSVFLAIQLIIFHGQRNNPLILLKTVYDASEIWLKLIIRQVDFEEVVVSLEDSLADYDGRHLTHTLVFETDSVVPLMEHHLADEAL